MGSILLGAYLARARSGVIIAGPFDSFEPFDSFASVFLRVFPIGSSCRPRSLLLGLQAFTLNTLEPIVGFSGQREFPSQ
jgi:hypothetical protein